jgi:hypothetical protein
MATRPRSITVLGWTFVVVGFSGVVRGALSLLKTTESVELAGSGMRELTDATVVVASGVLAILGGALTLRGSNWGRGLVAAWMAFHVVVGSLHSPVKSAVHALLFGAALYFLFRREAAEYFRISRAR